MTEYLHEQPDFGELLRIIEEETGVIPTLIEKDYWLMHVLYGLNQAGLVFELKGGTSLSKGYHIIDRFSEDIDIYIHPTEGFADIEANLHKSKNSHIQKRKDYYDYLVSAIKIDGIVKINRDPEFDNTKSYLSGGIRLHFDSITERIEGIKPGILLEVGFDNVTPNEPITIGSWAYDRAIKSGIEIIDNRAIGVRCYHPGYTFVEKLQTIATKYRRERETGIEIPNFMRQYYDVYCLLKKPIVLEFIGSEEYQLHKEKRFPPRDRETPIAKNDAYLLNNEAIRNRYAERYKATQNLYYNGQPDFDTILKCIKDHIERL